MPTKAKPITKNMRVAREIAKRNRAFKAASPAKRRVLIAADVIAQIKKKKLIPACGGWAQPIGKHGTMGYLEMEFSENASVRQLFLGDEIKCECCALGAVFMSCTLYNNKTTASDFDSETFFMDEIIDSRRTFKNQLTQVFSRAQLRLIECAFEGANGAFTPAEKDQDAVENWVARFPDSQKRLIAIMQNIIDNDGTFIP
jgi:hypothetical protein